MPFALVNPGATFSRVMIRLLKGLEGVDNYIDDILIHTLYVRRTRLEAQGSLQKAPYRETHCQTAQILHTCHRIY